MMNILDDDNFDFGTDDDLFNSMESTEESENEGKSEIVSPFDPRQIKITIETNTIYGLAKRLQRNEIDLYPNFQRRGNLWEKDRQSRLIESLLLRFPLPAFYFDVENEEKWLVVDGLQRLSTIRNFIVPTNDNMLTLSGLEILKDYEGLSFNGVNGEKGLDNTLKRRILETNVTTYLIQPGTPKEVKYNVFKRINTGGLGLTPMEIRHALNQKGTAARFLIDLTEKEDSFFKEFLKENKITKIDRMEDRELLLRYAAFSITSFKEYQPSLSNFLDIAMEKLDNLNNEKEKELMVNLEKAINGYNLLFGNKKFGRTLNNRCRLNSALFEVWTSLLGKLSDIEIKKLIKRNNKIKTEYSKILEKDENFHKSYSRSTANKSAVDTRFNTINSLITKYLND